MGAGTVANDEMTKSGRTGVTTAYIENMLVNLGREPWTA